MKANRADEAREPARVEPSQPFEAQPVVSSQGVESKLGVAPRRPLDQDGSDADFERRLGRPPALGPEASQEALENPTQ